MIPMTAANIKMRRRGQGGYALLLAIFLAATMILVASVAAPSILTQGRREKEAEMVWRGEQYERAIGLYYTKFGKYPTKIEDLTRVTNGVRFLRQAYKDPMNKEDGSWRFIYVGPNGQLIGSVKQVSLLQNALGMSNPTGAGSPFGGALQALAPPGQGQGITTGPAGPGAAGQQTNSAAMPNPLESQPQPLEGDIIGGNIVGVGSKVKQPSMRVYLGGDTYQKWEFIWNPAGQMAGPGQAPVNPNVNPTSIPNPANPTNPAGSGGLQPLQPPSGPGENPAPPAQPTQ
jgi:hypothetical protein